MTQINTIEIVERIDYFAVYWSCHGVRSMAVGETKIKALCEAFANIYHYANKPENPVDLNSFVFVQEGE